MNHSTAYAPLFAHSFRTTLAILAAMLLFFAAFCSVSAVAQEEYEDRVQEAYIIYYGRPADPEGLAFWSGELARLEGQLQAIIDTFGNSAEFLERFGALDSETLVNNIFLQLFGRGADAGGLAFYKNLFDTGALSLPNIALSILDGVPEGSSDATIIANRVAFAKAYTAAVAAGEIQYDFGTASSLLALVSASQASLENAIDNISGSMDDDADGVFDGDDVCPDTPADAAVDTLGCDESQRDAITELYRDRVQEAFISYYGRPADPGGLVFWAGVVAQLAGALDSIIDAFGNSAEFLDRFGLLEVAVLIDNIYQQLFGRGADSGGLTFYQGAFNDGTLTLPNIALNILAGVQPESSDGAIVANRVIFANAYTDAVADGLVDYDLEIASALLASVFGDQASLDAAIAAITGGGSSDSDGDGVDDGADSCPGTESGASVDSDGCSDTQLDSDEDGVSNAADQCPNTPRDVVIDASGCTPAQLDTDADGVNDAIDSCPATNAGLVVDANGCATNQLDSDGDTVSDADDACPGTDSGATVDSSGCADNQLDSDNDGVSNADDSCPESDAGLSVDGNGCADNQLDGDSDGVSNADDSCPETDAGLTVDGNGCADNQLDGDSDGVSNADDSCPDTDAGMIVDGNGCADNQLDSDNDGVNNADDSCSETGAGLTVDGNGCADNQLDGDSDGVSNADDSCPETDAGLTVDGDGCADNQLDSDSDGVSDADDICPNSDADTAVDATGCAANQLDSDNDGISNADDVCPDTKADAEVDGVGCADTQLDTDNDGVSNAADQCPGTEADTPVNGDGCADSQLDTDDDGVSDADDACPDTQAGATVDAVGCADTQLDTDNDGVSDADDTCPGTEVDSTVDESGCADSQLDSDNDGVSNAADSCPGTAADALVDTNGCAPSQLDSDNDGVSDDADDCPGTPDGEPLFFDNGCAFSQFPELEDTDRMFLVNELYYHYANVTGDVVWVLGYFGSEENTGDGFALLVNEPLTLKSEEVFPRGTAVSLVNAGLDIEEQDSLLLVRGEIQDYENYTGISIVEPAPIVIVQDVQILDAGDNPSDLLDLFLDIRDVSAPLLEPLTEPQSWAPAPLSPEYAVLHALNEANTGTPVQDCDRAIIISGGADEKNNHDRYRVNIAAGVKKLKELGYSDAQIQVFYNDDGDVLVDGNGELQENPGAGISSVKDQNATKALIQAHIAKIKDEMPASCTLTIFVTDHGTGFDPVKGYSGQRYAETGVDSTSSGGLVYREDMLKVDGSKKILYLSETYVKHGRTFRFIRESENGDIVATVEISGGDWTTIEGNPGGNNHMSEVELNFDVDGDGTLEDNWGYRLPMLTFTKLHLGNDWDSNKDGTIDRRLRWDGMRYVFEVLVEGMWIEGGRDTNDDLMIDATDGGVDFNGDGDKEDFIGFSEGINLWGDEVLWDHELADALRPLGKTGKGIHINIDLYICYAGGFKDNLEDIVETGFSSSSEEKVTYSRGQPDGSVTAVGMLEFFNNMVGIGPEDFRNAGAAAKTADDAAGMAAGDPINAYDTWGTPRHVTNTMFMDDGAGGYWVKVDKPLPLVDDVYDFEVIFGLQNPRWNDANVTIGEFTNTFNEFEVVPVAGGISARTTDFFEVQDGTIFRLQSDGPPLGDVLRLDFTDEEHKKIAYTIASRGEFELPPDEPDNPEENSSVEFSDPPRNCVTHDGPPLFAPSAFSTLQWLWFLNAVLASPYEQYLVEISLTDPFNQTVVFEVPLTTASTLFFEVGIFSTGYYEWEILGIRNATTGNALPMTHVIGGSGSFEVDPDLSIEANENMCGDCPQCE